MHRNINKVLGPQFNHLLKKKNSVLSSCSVLLTKYFSGDQFEKNEKGGACSMYGGEERCIHDFGGET